MCSWIGDANSVQNDHAWIALQEAGNNEKNHNSNTAKIAIALNEA